MRSDRNYGRHISGKWLSQSEKTLHCSETLCQKDFGSILQKNNCYDYTKKKLNTDINSSTFFHIAEYLILFPPLAGAGGGFPLIQ